MKKLVILIVAFAFASTAMGGQFPDVPTAHWAHGAVEVLANAGIFDGADGKLYLIEGKYQGKRLLNRYQIATIVAKILKKTDAITDAPEKSVYFTDVPDTYMGHNAIMSAVNAGILNGHEGKFHGNKLVNRFQMATVLAKILAKKGIKIDSPESPVQFTDLAPSHWAYGAAQSVMEAGILQGYEDKFHGKRLINRYQTAVIIAKLLAKLENP